MHDWTAKQQFHHMFPILQLGGRHCLVGFLSELHIDVCYEHNMPLEAAEKTINGQQVKHHQLVEVDLLVRYSLTGCVFEEFG